MKNEKIVYAFNSVMLSENDTKRIYSSILSSAEPKQKRTVSKRFVSVLAAAVIVVLAAGTVFAERIISVLSNDEYTVVDMHGNIMYGTVEYETDDSDIRYNEEWMLNHSSYTMLAIESDTVSAVFHGLGRNVYGDYGELKGLIPENSLLQLPEYIPEGFEFSGACVSLYLTEEEAEHAVQAELPFMSEGIVYQCYQLPESITNNIESIMVTYTNEDGEIIQVMSALLKDSALISVQSDVKVDVFEIAGFERAVCTRERRRTYCAAEADIEPVAIFTKDILGYEERAAMHGTEVIHPCSVKYSVKNYTVSSETVSPDELLKILKSLA